MVCCQGYMTYFFRNCILQSVTAMVSTSFSGHCESKLDVNRIIFESFWPEKVTKPVPSAPKRPGVDLICHLKPNYNYPNREYLMMGSR